MAWHGIDLGIYRWWASVDCMPPCNRNCYNFCYLWEPPLISFSIPLAKAAGWSVRIKWKEKQSQNPNNPSYLDIPSAYIPFPLQFPSFPHMGSKSCLCESKNAFFLMIIEDYIKNNHLEDGQSRRRNYLLQNLKIAKKKM